MGSGLRGWRWGILGGFIALAAAASPVARPGEGAIWTQLVSLLLFGPMSLAGGYPAARRSERL